MFPVLLALEIREATLLPDDNEEEEAEEPTED
jgi:hypothetical protein